MEENLITEIKGMLADATRDELEELCRWCSGREEFLERLEYNAAKVKRALGDQLYTSKKGDGDEGES